MTTGKGLRLAVRVRRRSQAYCLGFDNQSRQISVRESSIVPDYVKELPAAGFQPRALELAACLPPRSPAGSWELEAGSGFQLIILQTVVSSFPLNTQLLRALFCWEKRIMVKPHG